VKTENVTSIFKRKPESQDREVQILVVDDVATNRATIKTLLHKESYKVVEAADGAKALEAITSNHFDLVVLDIVMPLLDGLQVLEKIRSQYSEAELPVLILTVKDEIGDVVRGLQLGANDYITRPIDYTVLVTRINRLVTYKLQQDAIRSSQQSLENKIAERTNELIDTNRALRAQVAERVFAEEKARESEENYRALYNDTPAMFFTINEDDYIVSANRFALYSLSYEASEIVGKPLWGLYRDTDRDTVQNRLKEARNTPGLIVHWEGCMLSCADKKVWVRVSARSIQKENTSQIFVVCEDITRTKELSSQLDHLTNYDRVTNLYNRHAFELQLERALQESGDRNSTLCYLEVDPLQIIRESFGVEAGDALLLHISCLLKEMVRSNDVLGRLDGDRFGVVIKNCDLIMAKQSAKRICEAISAQRFSWNDQDFSLTPSMGLAPIRAGLGGTNGIVSAADSACYVAKTKKNTNGVCVYDESDDVLARRKKEVTMVSDIRNAIDQNLFRLHGQAVIPVDEKAPVKERFCVIIPHIVNRHGDLIQSEIYMPLVERYRYFLQIDIRVVQDTIEWIAKSKSWSKRWTRCFVPIALNSEITAVIKEQLEKNKVAPESVAFVLAGSEAAANIAAARDLCGALRAIGCKVALDGYGSGFGSFELLKQIDVEYVFIDGSLIEELDTQQVDRAIVRAINEVVHSIGRKTIAKNVQHRFIVGELREIGIDYAQGMFIHEPRPIEVLHLWEGQ